MILKGAGGGGVTLFPYYELGGAVENFQRKLHRAWGGGGNHFLDLLVSTYKKTQDCLMLSKS